MSVQTLSKEAAEVQTLIDAQRKAICAKNLDAILKPYAADAVLFDVKPPFQIVGTAAWKAVWEQCLPYFPANCSIESRDEKIHVSGDLAATHSVFRLRGMPEGHPAEKMWMRLSAVYRKIGGSWTIVHEHVSVPIDPCNGQACCGEPAAAK